MDFSASIEHFEKTDPSSVFLTSSALQKSIPQEFQLIAAEDTNEPSIIWGEQIFLSDAASKALGFKKIVVPAHANVPGFSSLVFSSRLTALVPKICDKDRGVSKFLHMHVHHFPDGDKVLMFSAKRTISNLLSLFVEAKKNGFSPTTLTLMITHKPETITKYDVSWKFSKGKIETGDILRAERPINLGAYFHGKWEEDLFSPVYANLKIDEEAIAYIDKCITLAETAVI